MAQPRIVGTQLDSNTVSYSNLATDVKNTVGRKNVILNGNFDIWQRGSSLGSGTGDRLLADRFRHASVGSTYTVARQVFTLGQTDVPCEPTYYSRAVVTSVAGAANVTIMQQRVESVRTLAGKTATLSFYAKADASKNIAVDFEQYFGTGGSPSAGVVVSPTTCALTTAWQKFTITAAIPSISGKTLGTDIDDSLRGTLWFDAGSDWNARTNSLGQQSGTFDIAQVQLELGSVATDFERRSLGEELLLCQRYYSKSYNLETPPGTNLGAGSTGEYGVWIAASSDEAFTANAFPIFMRAVPVVAIYNLAGAITGTHRAAGGGGDTTGVAADYLSVVAITRLYKVAGWSIGNALLSAWTADAEL